MPETDVKTKKAQRWAGKPPPERIRIYLEMRNHLIAVSELTEDDHERRCLMLLSRQFAGTAAQVERTELVRESCCFQAVTFGSCRCSA